MKHAEDTLQIAVMTYIRQCHPMVFAIHVANERKCSPRAGARLKAKGVAKGCPDILLWIKNHEGIVPCAIELKAGKNGLTDSQKAWRDKFLEWGGKWAMCKSIDGVAESLAQWGSPSICSL